MSEHEAIHSFWDSIIAIQLTPCCSVEDVERRNEAQSVLMQKLHELPEETRNAVHASCLSDLICMK